ncbi:MAG: cysteine peptidase family C39 domain-containing protein, partial [Rickettsia sp.]|uniref:cysteine peptidase family C39 domain-containing protein n=1 Tax=Rickettsia sp. TaxID=789 RepID=UPI00397E8032
MQKVVSDVQSAIVCSQLLLQLTGIKINEDILPLPNQNISSNLNELNKTYGVKLKQKHIIYHYLTHKDLPLAFLSNDGEYMILAKMDQDNALVQHPFKSNTELWSREQLCHQWSGAVIILSTPSLKFNISWFVPVFWQYRYILAEILLFSLVLQLLGLVLPLFFQIVMDKVLAYQVTATLDVLVFGLVITSIFEVLLKGL